MAYDYSDDREVSNYRETPVMDYSVPFKTVSVDQVIEMMDRTWVMYFRSASGMGDVQVLPAYPDDTRKMRFPCLVMSQVGEARWTLGKCDGYYGVISGETSSTLHEIRGYRYKAMYQFDLYTRTIKDQTKYEALIATHLRKGGVARPYSSVGISEIPINDYSEYPTVTATELRMRFRAYEDVDSSRIPKAFDQQLHQTSLRVSFWSDIVKNNEEDRVLTIKPDITLSNV